MNAAEKLFQYLGNPRGQLTVFLSPLPDGKKELIVWVKNGFNKVRIPSTFSGYPVNIQKMPQVTSQTDVGNLIFQ